MIRTHLHWSVALECLQLVAVHYTGTYFSFGISCGVGCVCDYMDGRFPKLCRLRYWGIVLQIPDIIGIPGIRTGVALQGLGKTVFSMLRCFDRRCACMQQASHT